MGERENGRVGDGYEVSALDLPFPLNRFPISPE